MAQLVLSQGRELHSQTPHFKGTGCGSSGLYTQHWREDGWISGAPWSGFGELQASERDLVSPKQNKNEANAFDHAHLHMHKHT